MNICIFANKFGAHKVLSPWRNWLVTRCLRSVRATPLQEQLVMNRWWKPGFEHWNQVHHQERWNDQYIIHGNMVIEFSAQKGTCLNSIWYRRNDAWLTRTPFSCHVRQKDHRCPYLCQKQPSWIDLSMKSSLASTTNATVGTQPGSQGVPANQYRFAGEHD